MARFGELDTMAMPSQQATVSVRGQTMPREVAEAIQAVADRYGLDPEVVAAVVEVESRFNPATSTGSYMGATQLGATELREMGISTSAYKSMSLPEQIGVYGDYLAHRSYPEKMSRYGLEPGKLSKEEQFASLMGVQFAPNQPERWAGAIARGDTSSVVTPTRQARELGGQSPTVGDLMAGFGSISSRLDVSTGPSFNAPAQATVTGTPAAVPSAFDQYAGVATPQDARASAAMAAMDFQSLGDAAYGRDPASVIARDGRPIDPFGTGYVTEQTVSLAPADSRRADQMKGWSDDARTFVDAFANHAGQIVSEVQVNSAYRDPAYNAKVGGARSSAHTRGNAIDISTRGMSQAQVEGLIASARKAADEMGRGLGVGVYGGSVHFDIDPMRGKEVTVWGPSYTSKDAPGWAVEVATAKPEQIDKYVAAAVDPTLSVTSREQFDRERLANQQAALAAISDEITQIAQGRAPIDAPASALAPAPAVANTRAVSMPQGSDFTRSMPSFGSLPSMSSPFDALSAPQTAARGASSGVPGVSFASDRMGLSQPNDQSYGRPDFGPSGPFDRLNAMPANASDYGTRYSGPGISFGGATPSMADYGLGDRSISGQFGQFGQSAPSPVGRGFAGSPEVAANKAGSFSPSAPQTAAPTPGSVAAQEAARPSAAPASGNVSSPVGRGFAGSPEVAANKGGLPASITGDISMGFAQAPPAFGDLPSKRVDEAFKAVTPDAQVKAAAKPVEQPVARPAPPAAPPVAPPTRPPVAPPQAPRTTVAPVAPIAPPQPAFDPSWGVTGLAPSVMKDLSGLGLGAPPEGYQYGWSPMGSPAMVHANAPDYAKIAATGPGILGAIMGPEFGRITSQPSAPYDGATVTEGEGGSFKSVTLSGFDGVGGGAGNAGDNGPGSAKIVCSAMNRAYGFGSFRNAVWLRHSANLHPAYERGYHILFKPLIRFGYGGKTWPRRIVRATLEHIARHRTADIWKQSRGKSRDWIGAAWRMVLEPCCFAVGKIAEAKHDRHSRLFDDR